MFGDAVCSFNPVYGQGMTVAAQEAALLQQCLEQGDADLARRFFASAKDAIDIPWDIAVGNDLRHPKVQGPRSPKVRFMNWYIGARRRRACDRLPARRQSRSPADAAAQPSQCDAGNSG